ncbi:MAG: hypothetical protein COV48_08605 [Elusimicrobia bacterium CG11_big_fil_rev_8_21_14_0_20_64_6]|nr:MAG: hypothetical protein COV48_08605 [Elusimicrobia bacterium CG11_big_fil_rev_8_21_14_0_20_64_6]
MDTASLVYSYAAAALVAGAITAAFSPAINRVLNKLIPEEVAPAWSQFIKFALFVSSFVGGMPNTTPGRFIDRNGPAVPLPVEGAELLMVMKSVGGALTAASWTLFLFFGVTLSAYGVRRLLAVLKERRAAEAKAIEHREAKQQEDKARQDAGAVKHDEPPKPSEPAVASAAKSAPPAKP